MIKVPLMVEGVDLSDDAVLEGMDGELAELDWVSQGPLTLAVHYSDAHSAGAAVAEAEDWARRIHKLQPGAVVTRVLDELVAWNEIAVRCAVSPEAVRTWARGLRRGQARPFPSPRQAVPQGAGARMLLLYAWRDVLAWVREVLDLDPDEDMTYLDDGHLAELNGRLAAERPATLPSEFRRLPGDIWGPSGRIEMVGAGGVGSLTAAELIAAAEDARAVVALPAVDEDPELLPPLEWRPLHPSEGSRTA